MSKACIIYGSPVSGKTNFDRKLVKLKKACFLDIDLSTDLCGGASTAV